MYDPLAELLHQLESFRDLFCVAFDGTQYGVVDYPGEHPQGIGPVEIHVEGRGYL